MSPPIDAIGPYRIIRRLGSGGMSVVYLAHDPRLDRHVAIKLLHQGLDSPDYRRRLLREAKLAGSLDHRNIVKIFLVDEHEGVPYIVMEYVVGDTLAAIIQSKVPLSVVRKLELIDDLCSGLDHAWRKLRLVHRDIKPSNLIVDNSGVLRILDFGIAHAVETGVAEGTRVAGTPAYMAPEQISGGTVDQRCDIFSTGVLLYELLTYRRAFQGDSQAAIFERVLKTDPLPLLECDPGLDPELAHIVEHAMRKHQRDRYPDIQLMRDDLHRVRERLKRTGASDTTVQPIGTGRATVPVRAGSHMDGLLDAARSQRVAEHMTAARSAMAQLDFNRAIEALEGVLAIDPHHAEAQQLLDHAGRQLDSRRAAGWLEQARKHLGGGELELAAQLVEEADRLGAPAVEVRLLRRDLEKEQARRNQAEARASAVVQGLAQARHCLSSGDEAGAIQAAESVLAVDSDHVEARDLRVRALTALANRRRRERHNEQAQEVIRSSRALFEQGSIDLAVEMLAVFHPEHPHVTAELTSLRARAAERLRLESSRRARELRLSQGLAAAAASAKNERWADAHRAATEALELDPEHAEAMRILKEASEALAAEKRRIEWEHDVERLVAAARAEAAAGRLDEALSMVRGFSPAHDAVERLQLELEQALERRRREHAEREALERRAREREERRRRTQEERRARQVLARAMDVARNEDLELAIGMLEGVSPARPDVTAALAELRTRLQFRRAREAEQRAREEAARQAAENEQRAGEEAARHERAEAEPQASEEDRRETHLEAEQRRSHRRRRGVAWSVVSAALVALIALVWGLRLRNAEPVIRVSSPESSIGQDETSSSAPSVIRLESDPPGANVTVAGVNGSWVTPADIPVVPGQALTVLLSHPGYLELEKTLDPSQMAAGSARVNLERVPPITVVLSGPYPFAVVHGGQTLPAQRRHRFQLSEARTLQLRAPSYFLNRAIAVTARPGETFEYVVPRAGELSVRAPLLEQCRVTIGGQDLATPSYPPISRRAIAAGEHLVVLSCPDGRRVERRVSVPAGSSRTEIIK